MPEPKQLAVAQYAKLTVSDKARLMDDLFFMMEYGTANPQQSEGPGQDFDANMVADICTVLNGYSIQLTEEDDRPFGYRFNDHKQDGGEWCRWSLGAAKAPHLRENPFALRCHNGCVSSTVEGDPDAAENRINISAVVRTLNALDVPTQEVDESGGNYVVYLGHGVHDEQENRWTHPMALGPCYKQNGHLYGIEGDLSYGSNRRDADDTVTVYEPYEAVDTAKVAEDIAALYREVTGA